MSPWAGAGSAAGSESASHLNTAALSRGVDSCTPARYERLKDRVHFLARRFASSAALAAPLEGLACKLDSISVAALNEVSARLRELHDASPVVRAAMEEYDEKEGVDRAEAFLADLAEDRSSAPPEIVPLIDQYISRLREVIALSWDRQLGRRELDASVMQVRMSYSQDLDRILQGLLPSPAG
jgi:hypothetical protein